MAHKSELSSTDSSLFQHFLCLYSLLSNMNLGRRYGSLLYKPSAVLLPACLQIHKAYMVFYFKFLKTKQQLSKFTVRFNMLYPSIARGKCYLVFWKCESAESTKSTNCAFVPNERSLIRASL
ncbi:hypothetical protein CHARACLAT_002146 [Characodon lateralis]|uniref:Uncharacterized protein n=1 Tax=Characodon lateralis TaxID=208331 RepID=A0ABU7DDK4_9TELE|nr:hypothetical protein [Characodon lateralis]